MKKILLFLSAFIPLYFLINIKILIDIVMQNLSFNFLNTMTLVVLSVLIGLGIYGAYISIKHKHTKQCEIQILQKTAITEQYFLGYFSLFVLFALSFELERVSMFVVFVFIIVFIGIVYIKNDLFYINPFLNILGFNFYDVSFVDTNGLTHTAKFLCKGKLDLAKPMHTAKLSHQNFSIIIQ